MTSLNKTDLLEQLAKLSPAKRALLEKKLRAQGLLDPVAEPAALRTITRREGLGPVPLSFAQTRIWWLAQMEDEASAYLDPFVLDVRGPLDLDALQVSVNDLIARHEALRTAIVMQNGEPVQVVQEAATLALESIDLRPLAVEARELEAERLAHEETLRPMALTAAPLLRVVVLTLGADEHRLLLTLHHVITDGWSLGVLLRDLGALYEARVAGTTPALPELPIQYADFAQWQRQWMQGDTLDKLLAYWKKQLGGRLPVLELPTRSARPPVQTTRGATHRFIWGAGLKAQLDALGRQEGVTLFMMVMAACNLLLHRYTGQEDIAVGSLIANRNRRETEDLLGVFINTLVIRTDLSKQDEKGLTFRELLQRVRGVALEAFDHQDLPFEKLVEVLQPERNLSYTPLFQVLFILQNAPMTTLRWGEAELTFRPFDHGVAKYDVTLVLEETAGGLSGRIEYNTDLFTAEFVARMEGHLHTILTAACQAPTTQVAELPLLTAAERQVVLADWNQTAVEFLSPAEQHLNFHQLFERQVERTPEAVALVCDSETVTYRELNARANRLAHRLQAAGIGPEAVVAVYGERSIHFVTGLLAIFKAGGAYVPLDPAYPQERVTMMMQDAGMQVILTTREHQHDLPPLAGPSVPVLLLEEAVEATDAPTTNPESDVTPDTLAYIIFTSGSTGRPKGAMVEQKGMLNHLFAKVQDLELTAADHVAQNASQCFDISVWQFFAVLLVGGQVHIYRDAIAHDPLALFRAVEADGVSILEVVPSLLRAILDEMDLRAEARLSLQQLRWLIPTGEALPPAGARDWLARYPHIPLLNAYGPTECSDDVTHHAVRVAPGADVVQMPIGKPVANMRIYLLDRHRQPVPVGIPGELYVGGIGVGRGYLRDANQTAEAFFTDPFYGGRLYKTGDLGRHLPDGSIEYLGRVDHQVKVRGFRIELGEIEAALLRHPHVEQAVVVAREHRSGSRLAAYLIAEGEAPSVEALRETLKLSLPDYMVPTFFVYLDEFPLTLNGKIDRKALPEPQQEEAEAMFVAPRTPAEQIVADLFATVLGVAQVGATDNFFALGGHSLLATQLMSRLHLAFGGEYAMRLLFEAPTVAELTARVTREPVMVGRALPPVRSLAAAERGSIPLSYSQERIWFFEQLEPGTPTYHLPEAVRLRGGLDVAQLHTSFQRIVDRHESLRTVFAQAAGRPTQHVLPDAVVALPLVEAGSEEDALTQIMADMRVPFELEKGPLLRLKLYRLADDDHILFMMAHHIITDGWSTGLVLRELAAHYAGATLDEVQVHYADYALWQRAHLQGAALDVPLSYWKQQLCGTLPVLQLPTDRPRPVVQTFVGRNQYFVLPPALVDQLKAMSRQQGTTLYMTLLGAYAALLARYSGQEELMIGTPVAGRSRQEIEGIVGFFVNTLVLRLQVSFSQPFANLLAHVRETALGAFAHAEMPFEQLVEALQPERNLGHAPLFQTMFMLQNTSMEELQLTDLAVTPLQLDTVSAKFDLSLAMTEEAEGLVGRFEYNTDLFDPATIEQMAGHLTVLLQAAVANAHGPIAQLPLLSAVEAEQLLQGWNETHQAVPSGSAPRWIEQQAAVCPDASALVTAEGTLSFRELNEAANRLAHLLQAQGVGRDVLVGLCMERSAQMVIAALAIWKAGGAYVPLDPTYPQERLAHMVADSGVELLVTTRGVFERLPAHQAVVLCLEELHVDEQPTTNLAVEVGPDDLCYMIYTSGSTGKPKGALLHHRGLANYLHHAVETYFDKNGCGAGAPVHSSLSFDLTVTALWAPLVAGRSVHLLPDGGDVEALSYALREQGPFDVVKITPAHLLLLAQQLSPEEMQGAVRTLVIGGEALRPEHVALWQQHAPATRLLNEYGPTETVVGCALYEVNGSETTATYSIGGPIANMQMYVLDGELRPQPIGVPGELYIGGVGVGRGYHNRTELTAERFVPDPFRPSAGATLYRSGDLARWRADGTIEFLGRLDHQVKLRGYRIELGEIEAALAEHPTVREAVVIVRDERLVAYVVPQDGTTCAPIELRNQLASQLPEYMVPAAFVPLDQLPLTANGKVDTRALPAATGERLEAEAAYVAPRNETEAQVAAVFADLLQIREVGVHDSFFRLGGHSLLATQAVARISARFAVQIPLRALFEAPTVAGLAARLEGTGEGETYQQIAPIPVVARHQPLPLSFAQERMWFFEHWMKGTPTYNMPGAVRLRGELDVAALHQALQALVDRHEALRSRFLHTDDGPRVTFPPLALEVPLLDLREAEDREASLRATVQREAQRPFQLEFDVLMRATLVQLGADDHALLLNVHHTIGDGMSLRVLMEELSALYTAFCAGQPSPLAPLALQHADYACWQRDHLQGAELEERLAAWQELLGDDLPVLELPTDRPRPAVQSMRGANTARLMSTDLLQRLQQVGRRTDATLFMTLLAAYNVLLQRWSGQSDLVVGTPISGRDRAEAEGLVGCFVNTLAIRTQWTNEETFLDLLARVQQQTRSALTQGDVPFEKLVEALHVERDPSYSPLFQVMFTVQEEPLHALHLPDLTVEQVPYQAETAKVDLSFFLSATAEGLLCNCEFNADLFDEATIQRMLSHYETVLTAIAEQPEQLVVDVPLLTAAERQQVLTGWNDNAAPYEATLSTVDVFLAHAARTPDAIAVVDERTMLTYGQLRARATQVARYLRDQGVDRDVPVAICLSRSVQLIVGILGVTLAGGCYLPLESTLPPERVRYIMADAKAQLLITEERLLALLPDERPLTLCLDRDAALIDAQSSELLPVYTGPDDLFYLIYTSGTTGQPKGVAVPHRGVLNLTAEFQRLAPLHVGDGGTLYGSITFDVSVYEIFTTLLQGARLHLVPEQARGDKEAFFHWLADQDIQSVYVPPFLVKELLLFLDQTGRSLALTRLMTGVEPIPEPLLTAIARRLPDVRIINAYGPTEATIIATVYPIDPACTHDRNAPIGRPVANMQCYLLDANLQPVPIGVRGELYVGGIGVARGYWQRPELTAERFLPNPFVTDPNARLYRTGDLGRWLPDGTIEFCGRIDHQVKIRGLRIELGEIEQALTAHPAVREQVVIVREDRPGDKKIVAYLVTAAADELATSDLRRHLKRTLPDYMVPAHFVFLPHLPLTPNGKVDRRALPQPDAEPKRAVLADARALAAPRTATEQALAALWQELMAVPFVSTEDHFFDLGGHSLLALQMVAKIERTLGATLELQDVFSYPTLQEMAARIEERAAVGGAVEKIPRSPLAPHYPLSPAQQRMWFLYQLDQTLSAYNVFFYYKLAGPLNTSLFELAVNVMVARHESLRTLFDEVEGAPRQIVQPYLRLPVPLTDLRYLGPEEQEGALLHDIADVDRAPFHLSTGPLVRLHLFRVGEQEHRLYLNVHHIIIDGWSFQVFMAELFNVYEALAVGRGLQLPEQPIRYVDYAAWVTAKAERGEWGVAETYWLDRLAAPLPKLDLPLDYLRPDEQSFRGDLVKSRLPDELTAALRRVSKEQGVSLFMLSVAAYTTMLHLLSGDRDIIVGVPSAGRDASDLDGLVGLFVNTLAIRTDFTGVTCLHDLLRQVKQRCLEAFEHQQYPFDLLIDKLGLERNLSRPPIFSVMFSYANFLADTEAAPHAGLSLQTLDLAHRTSKADLTLTMAEEGEELVAYLEFSTDLFQRATAERFAQLLETVLQGFVQHLHDPLPTLSLLTAEDVQVYDQLNAAPAGRLNEATIDQLFEKAAGAYPDRLAVSSAEGELTFRDLNERANAVAQALLAMGLQRGEFVALLLERSIESVIGQLGVIKAGGAYVPIDLDYPTERIRYMLSDSGARYVLTRTSTRDRAQDLVATLASAPQAASTSQGAPATQATLAPQGLAPTAQATPAPQVLAIDADFRDNSTDNVGLGLTGTDLAYMIYTSGSTGLPKGTMLMHRGVVNLADWMRERYGYGPGQTVLQFASFSFDASVWETLGNLLNGVQIHLAAPQERQSLDDFAAIIAATGAVSTVIPNVFFKQLALHLRPDQAHQLATLRRLFVGGEMLLAEDVRLWQRRFGTTIAIVNAYGPTEATVLTALHDITAPVEDRATVLPVGTPPPHYEVYILNEHLQRCPVGARGEICVGGPGLARGYLHQREKTAEAFLPHPFSTTPGARLYRTGDIGRLLPDGTLECLGRRDSQIKVRGFRIEIGEIEAVLLEHPQIALAAVLAKRAAHGSYALLAAVSVRSVDTAQAVTEASIRSFLLNRLPDYMVPARIMLHEHLPLTPNGKIDRRQLDAQLELAEISEETVYEAPQTAVEAQLAAIYSAVTGHESVGRRDNFFQIGGDSILSMQTVALLKQAGIAIKTRDLFKHQTVAELAHFIATNQLFHDATDTVASELITGPVPLAALQQSVLEQGGEGLDRYVSGLFLDIAKPIDQQLMEQALAALLRHHDMLRTVYQFDATGVQQIVLAPEQVQLTLPLYDLSALDEAEQAARLKEIDYRLITGIRLTEAPLHQLALVRRGADDWSLRWVIHHLLVDGYSIRVLTQDLIATYEQLAAGQPVQLPAKSDSYRSWVTANRTAVNGAVGAQLAAAWASLLPQLEQATTQCTLPADHPTGSNRYVDRDSIVLNLDADTTACLLQAELPTAGAAARGLHIRDVLLAALLCSLSVWTGQELLAITLQAHGRETLDEQVSLDLTRTVGCFVDRIPLAVHVAADQRAADLLLLLPDLLQQLPNGGLSFPMLRAFTEAPDRRAAFARIPLPPIEYNFIGQLDSGRTDVCWHLAEPDTEGLRRDDEAPNQLQIDAVILGGRLSIAFQYSQQQFTPATVQRLADQFATELLSLSPAKAHPKP